MLKGLLDNATHKVILASYKQLKFKSSKLATLMVLEYLLNS